MIPLDCMIGAADACVYRLSRILIIEFEYHASILLLMLVDSYQRGRSLEFSRLGTSLIKETLA